MTGSLISLTSQNTSIEFVEPITTKLILSDLPDELIMTIFSFLSPREIIQLSIICKSWKQLTDNNIVSKVFNNKINNPSGTKDYMQRIWASLRYQKLSQKFGRLKRFGLAVVESEKSAKNDSLNGSESYFELCKMACVIKNYPIAIQCQKLARIHNALYGIKAMKCYINTLVADEKFIQESDELIKLSKSLYVDEHPTYGINALINIAKQFATRNLWEKARECTALSAIWEKSTKGWGVPHVYAEITSHMIELKQFNQAESYARKIDKSRDVHERYYVQIIIGELHEENFINESLLAEINPQLFSWYDVYKKLINALIDNHRFDEAYKYAKILLQNEHHSYKSQFKQELAVKLNKLTSDTPSLMQLKSCLD